MSQVELLVQSLPGKTRIQLIAIWRENFNHPPHSKLRRELMVRLLAYRLQERAFGGLEAATCKRLDELARHFERNPHLAPPGTPLFKPGTRLRREWKGVIHEVTILENGYQHSGKRYGSLSEIARVITRTRWSGPLFFGIKQKRRPAP